MMASMDKGLSPMEKNAHVGSLFNLEIILVSL